MLWRQMVGSRTIAQHDKDELLSSHFKGKALHILYPDIFEFCNHIIGKVLSQYKWTENRETPEKIRQSKHATEGNGLNDKRYDKNEKIDQFQLLWHFISAVVVLNLMWDIALQNIMTQQNYWEMGEVPTKMTFTMHCPYPHQFKKWRLDYPKNTNVIIPLIMRNMVLKNTNQEDMWMFMNFTSILLRLNKSVIITKQ